MTPRVSAGFVTSLFVMALFGAVLVGVPGVLADHTAGAPDASVQEGQSSQFFNVTISSNEQIITGAVLDEFVFELPAGLTTLAWNDACFNTPGWEATENNGVDPRNLTVTPLAGGLAQGQDQTFGLCVDSSTGSAGSHLVTTTDSEAETSSFTLVVDAAPVVVLPGNITAPTSNLTIIEGQAAGTFTVNLTTNVTAGQTVMVNVTGGDAANYNLSLDGSPGSFSNQVSFTFKENGEADYSGGQFEWNDSNATVYVQAIADGLDDHGADGLGDIPTNITLSVNSSGLDSAFANATVQYQNLVIIDNNTAFVVTGVDTISEASGSNSTDFQVQLDARPTGNVTIDLSAGGHTFQNETGGTEIRFNTTTWNVTQNVTFTGADDTTLDGQEILTATLTVNNASSTAPEWNDTVKSVSITQNDDDVAGVTITETGGSTQTSENGTTDSFNIQLSAKPLGNVTLTISSNNTNEITVNDTSIEFSPDQWNTTVHNITLAGIDDLDQLVDGNQIVGITIAVVDDPADIATHPTWDSMASTTFNATNLDDDLAQLNVTPLFIDLNESAEQGTFTVNLTGKPSADVVIDLTSDNTGVVTVSPATLTFGSGNWTSSQTVTATTVDNSFIAAVSPTNITASVNDSLSQDLFDAADDVKVQINVTDDDAATIIVSPTGNITISENGGVDTFTVRLTGDPLTTVVFNVTRENINVTFTPATLTFTGGSGGNFQTPQTVTVTGVNNDRLGNDTANITITPRAGQSAPHYDTATPVSVQFNLTDDDAAGLTVTETGGSSSVTEGGDGDIIQVQLTAEPSDDVTLNITTENATHAAVDVTKLTFGSGNWSVPQNVTINATDDNLDRADASFDVTVSVDNSSLVTADVPFFTGLNSTVSVLSIDNDLAAIVIGNATGFDFNDLNVSELDPASPASFNVTLATMPTSDVFINLTSADLGEVTVSPAVLQFTNASGNWSMNQTVTVTAVDDSIQDGNQTTAISLVIDQSATLDDVYDAVAGTSVNVRTVDDGIAKAIKISNFTGIDYTTLNVTEGTGTPDTTKFNVSLATPPGGDVTVNIVSSDNGEITRLPANLVFTNATYNVQQTVTLTSVNDGDEIDGNQTVSFTLSVVDAISADSYDDVANVIVTAVNVDDDVANLATNVTSLTVGENGGTNSFTVNLTGQPQSNVVVNVASNDTSQITVDNATLTFTNANWATHQFVTVTGVDDTVIGDNPAIGVTLSFDDANSNDFFDDVADSYVTVSITDDDTPAIVTSTTLLNVSEHGSATFGVTLSGDPAVDVVLGVVSNETANATVSPANLTFTTGNFNVPQLVTVTGVANDTLNNYTSVIWLSVDVGESSPLFNSTSDEEVSVTVFNEDAANFTLNLTSFSVTEAGSTQNFSVVLDAQPTDDVNLTVSGSDSTELTLTDDNEGPASQVNLTFTSTNWNVQQNVTVTGVDDLVDDGNVNSFVNITVDVGGFNSTYENSSAFQQVVVTTIDDDAAGIVLANFTGFDIGDLNVTEGSLTPAKFNVSLATAPAADGEVVLVISSSDTTEVGRTPATLTFNSTKPWNVPQAVSLLSVNDGDEIDGDQTVTITVSVSAGLSSDEYDGVANSTLSVVNKDDDVAGMNKSPSTLTIGENGGNGSFTVNLTGQPQSDVVVKVSSNDTNEATIDNATLTFTNANWNVNQYVTVTAVDDTNIGENPDVGVRLSIDDPASNDFFDALADSFVTVSITDDDTAAIVTDISAVNVSEDGTTTFTVKLSGDPVVDVVLGLVSSETANATVSPANLTFTNSNFAAPQTVTVTGVPSNLLSNQSSVIAISVDDSLSSPVFHAATDENVAVNVFNNDLANYTVNVTSFSVTEAGSSGNFSVVLDAQPSDDVKLSIAGSDPSELNLTDDDEGPAQLVNLTFTNANWNIPQNVSATGVDDSVDDGDVVTFVNITVAVGGFNSTYENSSAFQQVIVTTVDDETAGIVFSNSTGFDIADLNVTEGSASPSEFNVTLASEPTGVVQLAISSGDTGEVTVSPATLTFGAGNWRTGQTVSLVSVNDTIADGNQTTAISLAIDVSATNDDVYDAVSPASINVKTIDDDAAEFILSTTTATVNETGTKSTFTVVLGNASLTNVVFSVASSDTAEATIDNSTLTFTPANWNITQTVTITGAQDNIVDGSQPSNVVVSVVDASSDDAFDNLADQTVVVTTDDDDVPEYSVSKTSVTVNETGTSDTFTIVLLNGTTTQVVFDLASNDTAEATVAPAQVTFGAGNWSTAQTITVTGVDDNEVDGSQWANITVSVNAAATNDTFDSLPDTTIAVTNEDDDAAGFSVAETGGGTSVGENAGTDNFTVVLDSIPTGVVVFGIESADPANVTVNKANLTFGVANWSTPQEIILTGVDNDVDGVDFTVNITVSVDAASTAAAGYGSLANQTVVATLVDDDVSGLTLTNATGFNIADLNVTEAGSTTQFNVSLATKPSGDVVIDVASPDLSEVTVAPAVLTFGVGNWSTPQTVTATGVDDSIADGNITTAVSLTINASATADSKYDLVSASSVNVRTVDDDAAGFTLSKTTVNVAETGTTDTFTVVLDNASLTNVVLSVVSGDTGEATVDNSTLTFTSANWNTPQTVTVTGVDDALLDGDQVAVITVSVVDASSDDAFDALPDQTVAVTVTDDDSAGFILSESTLTVDESGTSETFTVVLANGTTTSVVFDISSDNLSEASVSPATLTFGAGNWSTPQTVTVTGVNDNVVDGSQLATITVAVNDAASDDGFDPLPNQTVAVTVTDDDAPGFTVTETGGSTITSETGTTDNVTVALAAIPSGDVVIAVTVVDATEISAAPVSLTFGAGNWSTPQEVVFTGLDDGLVDGDITSNVIFSINDALSHDAYDPVLDQNLAVTNTDDEVAGYTVSDLGGIQVTEGGASDNFSVVLTAAPLSNVVIDFSTTPAGKLSFAPASATFTPANWNTVQIVNVTAVDDSVADGLTIVTITASINDASSHDAFDNLANQTMSASILENDAAGVILGNTTALTATEGGATATVTVRLASQPTATVTIPVTNTNTTQGTVSPTNLTFGAGNWSVNQTVTITAVNDAVIDGAKSTTVTIGAPTGAAEYAALSAQTFAVTLADNDVAGFTPNPTAVTVSETGTTDTFTLVLTAQPASNVVLALSSNDTGEATVAPTSVTFGPGNWSTAQTITVTGVDDTTRDGTQTSTITIAVVDAQSDDDWDPVANGTVTVSTLDDEAPGFAVSPTTAALTEASGSSNSTTVTVSLLGQPTSNVVIDVAADLAGQITLNRSSLTFTPSTAGTPQAITVTAVDDALVEGVHNVTLTFSVNDASSDNDYDPLPARTAILTITDNDPGLIMAGQTSLAVTEGSDTADSFTVRLSQQPTAEVTVTYTADAQVRVSQGNGTPAATVPVVFTTANWNVAQTVLVRSANDTASEGPHSGIISVAVASTDAGYNGLTVANLTVAVTDDEFFLTPAQVAQFNGRITYTVTQTAQGNVIEWDFSQLTDDEIAGLQLWASNSPYTLLETYNAGSSGFDGKTFLHTNAAGALATTKYLVTVFYADGVGFFGPGTAPDTADYAGTLPTAQVAEEDTPITDEWWFWLLIAIAILVIILIIILIILAARRTKDEDDWEDDDYDWDDDDDDDEPEPEPEPAPVAAPVKQRAAAKPAKTGKDSDVHHLNCPRCRHRFDVKGKKPITTTCPNCKVKGMLH